MTVDVDVRRLALYTGPVAVAVAFLGIVGAAVLAPEFSWTGDALSDLGARGEPTAPIFNGGLILAGVLGLLFTWRVWTAAANHVQRIGILLFAGSLVAMALVGVYPLPEQEHGTVAVAFFALFTYALFVFGTGDALDDHRRRGLAAIWFGVAHPTAWITSVLVGFEGIAIPETAGSVLLAAWVLLLFQSLRQ